MERTSKDLAKRDYQLMENRKRTALIIIASVSVLITLILIYFGYRRFYVQEVTYPTVSHVYLPIVMNDYEPPNPHKGVCIDSVSGVQRCEPIYAVGATSSRTWYPVAFCCEDVIAYPCISTMTQAQDVLSGTLDIVGCGTDKVLMFNEPHLQGISYEDAADTIHAIKQANPDKVLVSPAVSHYPAAKVWLINMTNYYTITYPGMPFEVLDWHCYAGTAAECITHAEGMIALGESWGIDTFYMSEVGLLSLAEFSTFLDYLETSEIDKWFAFVTESDTWSQYALVVPGSDPTVLTTRGTEYANR